jgi:hypothetical protein
MPHAVLRRAIAAIAASLMLIISPVHAQDEVRVLWVVRTTLAAQPAFDPLATTIAKAHEAGLQVHAWINVKQTARRLGVGGIILFSYDSLADPVRGPGYVSQVGRAAFQF